MEETIDYRRLYALQDRILGIVFGLDNDFYLTGGTALHRFYYNLRYSVDLDFFSSYDQLFSESILQIVNACDDNGIEYERVVQARDFQRVMIEKELRLDFVNDRVYREGKSAIIRGMRIDNTLNILTNKIVAITTRDEEKDVFDLFAIAYHEAYNWGEVLKIAKRKARIERSLFIERLRAFPLEWLSNIRILQRIPIGDEEISLICGDIINEADNSLYGKA